MDSALIGVGQAVSLKSEISVIQILPLMFIASETWKISFLNCKVKRLEKVASEIDSSSRPMIL